MSCYMQGSLAQLDSQNPVMYVDFPQGRLKFLGTIVFPKNKYMLLKFGQKDVLCEDIFENMVRRFERSEASHYSRLSLCSAYPLQQLRWSQIVFPEAHWVGTKEDNPTEKPLPMPAELQASVHEKYTFGGAAHQTGELRSMHLLT